MMILRTASVPGDPPLSHKEPGWPQPQVLCPFQSSLLPSWPHQLCLTLHTPPIHYGSANFPNDTEEGFLYHPHFMEEKIILEK